MKFKNFKVGQEVLVIGKNSDIEHTYNCVGKISSINPEDCYDIVVQFDLRKYKLKKEREAYVSEELIPNTKAARILYGVVNE